MKENELPYYGVGPYYCGSIIIVTIASIVLSYLIWGALKSDIHDNIDNDQLITSGAYAYVRNPIYSAFLFLATGMIVFYGNIILFVLPILYWALLTELMKRTEEKWLEEKFGDEYRKYCKEVNRCIPWFK